MPRKRQSGLLRLGIVGANRESFPLFRCPDCHATGNIDEDQFHGRVSIICANCPYHETVDWWSKDESTETDLHKPNCSGG